VIGNKYYPSVFVLFYFLGTSILSEAARIIAIIAFIGPGPPGLVYTAVGDNIN
jgi:hypothetical protein